MFFALLLIYHIVNICVLIFLYVKIKSIQDHVNRFEDQITLNPGFAGNDDDNQHPLELN